MRRLLGTVLTLVLLVPALAVLAGGTANYTDRFDSGDYSGNNGSLIFDGPWTEYGDSGGHSSGLVQVNSSGCSGECAHIDGGGLVVTAYGLDRAADLSMFASVELSFDVSVDPDSLLGLLPANTASLQVQVYDEGWVTIESFHLGQSRSEPVVIDVTGHANEDFEVRFGVPTGSLIYNGTATIDDVQLSGTISATTTTTTTTTPTLTAPTLPTPTITTPTLPILPGLPTTSTTRPSSSTVPGSAPTTTVVGGSSDDDGVGAAAGTTTTTVDDRTIDSNDDEVVVVASGIPPGSGLHEAGVGLIADYERGLMGDLNMDEVNVLGAEMTADFSMAVEAFEATRLWIGALALLMATAVVSGMDRRRSRREGAVLSG